MKEMNDDRATHLDLFSGIGGFAIAAERCGWKTVAFCEREKFAQRVLRKHWPSVPIIDDIHDLDGREYQGVSLLTGGFNCQPYSFAGRKLGALDHRAIWPEMLRVITEARPRFVVGENVAGIINMELDDVLSSLEAASYSVGAVIVPACAVDAKHRRDRVWIIGADTLANTIGGRRPGSGQLIDASNQEAHREREADESLDGCIGQEWEAEPDVGRVAYGIPERSHRLRGLGNAIVPQVAEKILTALIESER